LPTRWRRKPTDMIDMERNFVTVNAVHCCRNWFGWTCRWLVTEPSTSVRRSSLSYESLLISRWRQVYADCSAVYFHYSCLQCSDAVGWAAGRASGLQKIEWRGAGMVICLELGAVLHMAQLMPLPLTVSCFSKIQIGFTLLVPARLGSPGKGLLNGCVCTLCQCGCRNKNCSNFAVD